MKRILIADASKASLVMTSEVFKDHFPGVQVAVARNSFDAIEALKLNGDVDAIVIDFDLPDRNGAETAARIKKLCSTPVLITAFDRPDVKEAIETELAAYDDCLSWLKKPVNAELVVSIVKRFCEGRYRTQRRVDCLLPVLLELSTKGKEIVAKSDSKGSKNLPSKLWIPVVVEDCSVGGLKLLLRKKDLEKLGLGKASFSSSSMKTGEFLNIQLPTFEDIQSGRAATKNWLKAANAGATTDAKSAAKFKPVRTIDSENSIGSALKGKVIWSKLTDNGDLSFGIQSENNVLSKRLFEAALVYVKKVTELGLNPFEDDNEPIAAAEPVKVKASDKKVVVEKKTVEKKIVEVKKAVPKKAEPSTVKKVESKPAKKASKPAAPAKKSKPVAKPAAKSKAKSATKSKSHTHTLKKAVKKR